MNWRTIWTLVLKDLTLFSRNRFFAFVSVFGLLAYIGIYFLMPSTVDELLQVAVYAPALPAFLPERIPQEGLEIVRMDSEEALKEAVAAGEYGLGFVLPAELAAPPAGQKIQVRVYFTADLPEELQETYSAMLRELVLLLLGQPLNVQIDEQVLGVDMAGVQIPPRDRMLPLLAVFAMMVETMGLASLLSGEIEARTLQALLVSPLRVEGLFLGKSITGVGMTLIQAVLLLAVTGNIRRQTLLLLATLLLGALMVTGISFLLASVARSMTSVLGWGVLVVLLLGLPAFGVIFPGLLSNWVRAIPSYYLVDTVHRAANFGLGWEQAWPNLLILLGVDIVLFGLGILALRRKMR